MLKVLVPMGATLAGYLPGVFADHAEAIRVAVRADEVPELTALAAWTGRTVEIAERLGTIAVVDVSAPPL